MIHLNVFLAVTNLIVFYGFNSWAAEISKISGNKVLIKMEGKEFAPDDSVFAYKDGKKKALIQVLKVKEGAALGEVKKGKVEIGLMVKKDLKTTSPGADSSSGTMTMESKSYSDSSSRDESGNRIGVMGGIFQNNMTIEISGVTSNYSDMSMAISGFVDIPFGDNIDLRGKAGYLQYSVAEDSTAASLGYLSLEGTLQLRVVGGFWLGGGGAFLLTMSRNSDIPGLDASSATNSFFILGLGYDLSVKKNAIVPISLDYILFPGGTGISANSLALRTGYAWAF